MLLGGIYNSNTMSKQRLIWADSLKGWLMVLVIIGHAIQCILKEGCNDNFNNYDMVETPSINFVVGKNEEPKLDKTIEMETETFSSMTREISHEDNKVIPKDVKTNQGFVSYILLGFISFGISLLLLYLFIK